MREWSCREREEEEEKERQSGRGMEAVSLWRA